MLTWQQELRKNLESVLEQIALAAQRAKRDASEIIIVAATKAQPIEKINYYIELANEFGIAACIGENYQQEFQHKKPELIGPCSTHYIGRVQSGKIKGLTSEFDLIESLASWKHLQIANREAEAIGLIKNCFLQVNISEDPLKAGMNWLQVEEAFLRRAELSNLRISGLMTILADYADTQKTRHDYCLLAQKRDQLCNKLAVGQSLLEAPLKLSMGMSADFQIAIEAGADLVRIGSAIFGARNLTTG